MSDLENTRDPNKDKALTAALSQIERQFGKGAMMRLGNPPIPRATSSPSEPVEIEGIRSWGVSPRRIIAPLPNCLSI